jgi:hypothetical protein
VVDFKTDRELKNAEEQYRAQLATYLEAIRAAMLSAARGFLLVLRQSRIQASIPGSAPESALRVGACPTALKVLTRSTKLPGLLAECLFLLVVGDPKALVILTNVMRDDRWIPSSPRYVGILRVNIVGDIFP